jgi:UDP-glucose 4-epimerase
MDGHNVVILDNFSTGRKSNLVQARANSRLSVHHAEVFEFSAIQSFFKGMDWVFHLAAMADIVPSIQQPLLYHQANVEGTVSVLEAARMAGVKRFVYVASSSCYGIPDQFPTPETAPIRPMYPYALTKYLGEQCVLHWQKVFGLPCVSLRLFNVYGPRARTTGTYGAVFGVFLAQKLAGKSFTVVGDGKQTRDFTFVLDAVDALICAANSEVSGEIFNVGSGTTHSVNELTSLLGGPVVYIPKRPGEPDCTFADISKITKALGWRPRVSFQEGVQKVLQSIDEWKDAPVWDEKSIAHATQDWFHFLGKIKTKEIGL